MSEGWVASEEQTKGQGDAEVEQRHDGAAQWYLGVGNERRNLRGV